MTLFDILRLLSNNNLYFACSCILRILTQDRSLHACAKFDNFTLTYIRDTRDVFYVRRAVDLMKTAKVNAYIMHIFGKIELLSIHAT